MKKFLTMVPCALLLAVPASAATFYTGQTSHSPQFRYTPTGASPMTRTAQHNQWSPAPQQRHPGMQTHTMHQRPQQVMPPQQQASSAEGFSLSAGLSHQYAMWGFDMKTIGSKLHYDNITWNVFDAGIRYGFRTGDVMLRLDGGLRYGTQMGNSTMVDDDVTNGGTVYDFLYDPDTEEFLGYLVGQALSVGRSTGGSMLGYSVGITLADQFQFGRVRVNPGIGWRHLSYNLKTDRNKGMAMSIATEGSATTCFVVPGTQELQCIPVILVNTGGDNWAIITEEGQLVNGNVYIGNNYSYNQSGTSHDYKIEWAGPFVALELEYEVNPNNIMTGRLEIGLPGYSAIGNQPYRIDWATSNPIRDSAGIGSAFHIGLGANWMTAVSDNIMLTFGFSLDHYSVSGAEAKLSLNGAFWEARYWADINKNFDGSETAALNDPTSEASSIAGLFADCPNWICKDKNEIDSVYRSMGIRIGLAARF